MGDPQLDIGASELARLLRFAYLTCGDSALAHDLVQEAVYRVLRRERGGEILALEAYLRRTIVNVYASWRRVRSSTEVPRAEFVELTDEGFEQRVVDRHAVWEALRRLSRKQRVVLTLRYYEHLSDKQIAELLDWREATVRSLASRGLKALQKDAAVSRLADEPPPASIRGAHA